MLNKKVTNPLEKICCDLEQSKKLKELGIEMETRFYHCWDYNSYNLFCGDEPVIDNGVYTKCYTLEQIIEMLPQIIEDKVGDQIDPCHFSLSKHMLCYINHGCRPFFDGCRHYTTCPKEDDENLATTAARLLIKLKEDKII
jgi:hypothetical protein